MSVGGIEALGEEPAPIIIRHIVQRLDHIVERIRLDHDLTVVAAEKGAEKILQGSFALSLFSDDAVGFEPDEDALVVIVTAAAPSVAGKNRMNLRSEGSVGQ